MPQLLMQYRADRYLTVDEFAELLGVTPRTLYRIIGGTSARPTTIRKIAKALGVHPSAISEFTPPTNTSHPNILKPLPAVYEPMRRGDPPPDPPETTESAASVLARKMAEKPLGGNGE